LQVGCVPISDGVGCPTETVTPGTADSPIAVSRFHIGVYHIGGACATHICRGCASRISQPVLAKCASAGDAGDVGMRPGMVVRLGLALSAGLVVGLSDGLVVGLTMVRHIRVVFSVLHEVPAAAVCAARLGLTTDCRQLLRPARRPATQQATPGE